VMIPDFVESIADSQQDHEKAASLAQSVASWLLSPESDSSSFISISRPSDFSEESPRGRLSGCIYSVKDNIDVLGLPTTCGSRLFQNREPSSDAWLVRRLRNAGAHCVGKNNMHELALGATGVNPTFGTTRNPWAQERIAGGSSGGSAVSVALRQVHVAIGTDSGGSVRLPAAMCGVVGFKPTGGSVPLDGVQGAAWSIDNIGLFATAVADVASVWEEIRPSVDAKRHRTGRIAYLEEDRTGAVAQPVWDAYLAAIRQLQAGGLDLIGVSIPHLDAAPYVCVSVVYPEVASQHRELVRNHADLYSEDIRNLIYLGELWSARNYIDAQRLRSALEAEFRMHMTPYDAILMPTAAVQPQTIDEASQAAVKSSNDDLYTLMHYTVLFNVIGYPAISIPAGTDSDGLPVGLQAVGWPRDDIGLLEIAQTIEDHLGKMPAPPSSGAYSHRET
jgi:aspartyl-tRNA(Asn)/glutamyl-tRNA(Gln) amidotransferase subunit A